MNCTNGRARLLPSWTTQARQERRHLVRATSQRGHGSRRECRSGRGFVTPDGGGWMSGLTKLRPDLQKPHPNKGIGLTGGQGTRRAGPLKLGRSLALSLDRYLFLESDGLGLFLSQPEVLPAGPHATIRKMAHPIEPATTKPGAAHGHVPISSPRML
jgi:hypothetical protein